MRPAINIAEGRTITECRNVGEKKKLMEEYNIGKSEAIEDIEFMDLVGEMEKLKGVETKTIELKGKELEGSEGRVNKFRLAAKNIGMTYPRCGLTKETVLEVIKEKFGILLKGYVISVEQHQDGTPHVHVFVRLSRVKNICSARWLDIGGIHGKYEAVRSVDAWLAYVIKNNDYLTNLELKDGREYGYKEKALDLIKAGSLEQAIVVVREGLGEKSLEKYEQYKTNLTEMYFDLHPVVGASPFKQCTFIYPEEITN